MKILFDLKLKFDIKVLFNRHFFLWTIKLFTIPNKFIITIKSYFYNFFFAVFKNIGLFEQASISFLTSCYKANSSHQKPCIIFC